MKCKISWGICTNQLIFRMWENHCNHVGLFVCSSQNEKEWNISREREREMRERGDRERQRLKMWKKFWIEIVVGVREYEEKAEARTHVQVGPSTTILKFLLVFCWMKIERKAKTKERIYMNKRVREKRSSSRWPLGRGLWRSLTPRPVVAHLGPP